MQVRKNVSSIGCLCLLECLCLLCLKQVLVGTGSMASWGCHCAYSVVEVKRFLYSCFDLPVPHTSLLYRSCVHSCRALGLLYVNGVARMSRQMHCTLSLLLINLFHFLTWFHFRNTHSKITLSIIAKGDSRELNWMWIPKNASPIRLYQSCLDPLFTQVNLTFLVLAYCTYYNFYI